MAKTIAIFNQKGGVGKTTSVINLAAALSKMGKKVLICDIDPQSNTTSGLGFNKNLNKSIYNALIDEIDTKEAIVKTDINNLHILPSNIDLAGAEIELVDSESRNNSLSEALEGVQDNYNYILIDCPPSLSLLTLNALVASDAVIIPIQCEYYSLEGLTQLLKTIDLVKRGMNPNLKIEGILLTMSDKRTNLTNQVIENVQNYFKDLVYKTVIPRNIRLAEAPSFGKSIFEYDPKSNGAKAYWKLAEEVIKKQV